jgi:cytochrome c peroxidase
MLPALPFSAVAVLLGDGVLKQLQLRRSPQTSSCFPHSLNCRKMLFDPSLSGSGRASCHRPADAYGPPNGLAVQSANATGAKQACERRRL